MSSGWTIESWSRELSRGTIRADQMGSLGFDGAIADVDDFVVGEAVLVEFERHHGTFRVTRVSPDIPRFRDPSAATAVTDAPKLESENAARLLEALPTRYVDSVHAFSTDGLVIEGINDTSYTETIRYRLLLRGVEYVELPLRWETKLVRLSTSEERAYLSNRFDQNGEPFLAITWITEERRFHFVVCASIESVAIMGIGDSRAGCGSDPRNPRTI